MLEELDPEISNMLQIVDIILSRLDYETAILLLNGALLDLAMLGIEDGPDIDAICNKNEEINGIIARN